MYVAGMTITALAGLGILTIGILYLTIPRTMAGSFGLPSVPDANATPWLRLKGIRDLATGIVAIILLLTAPTNVLAWTVAAFAIIPAGDAVTILRAGGSRRAAIGIHGVTAALMFAGAAALFIA